MKTVTLYGELAKRFGKHHRLAVRSAAEALRALKANCRGFEKFMNEAHLEGLGFRMYVGGESIKGYDQIHNPAGKAEVIRLVPVVVGAKNGFFQILTGALLIAAAVVAAPFTAGTSLAFLPQAVGVLGASMILGGVATLLSPPPKEAKVDRKTSHMFNGPVNTAAQGSAIPVGYGRMIIGSLVISSGVETHEA